MCQHFVPLLDCGSVFRSGKRKITLIGSDLEIVEGVLHSHAKKEIIPTNSNSQVSLHTHTHIQKPLEHLMPTYTSYIRCIMYFCIFVLIAESNL